jgi:penicillin-insensitive murein endopeptidase
MGRIVAIIALLAGLAACESLPDSEPPGTLSSRNIPAEMQGVHAKQFFGAKQQASRQSPDVHGGYAKGCLAGGVALPETGPTWQAMRLSRNRNWGHPQLIDFIAPVVELGLVLVGQDLAI